MTIYVWNTEKSGFAFRQKKELRRSDRLEGTPSLIRYGFLEDPSLGKRWPGFEESVEVVNASSCTCIPPYVIMAECPIKHGENFTFLWPYIVTHFFIIKPTRCTNFTNLFWHETLHVSDSSSVHHQEFIHCTLSNGICHTGL